MGDVPLSLRLCTLGTLGKRANWSTGSAGIAFLLPSWTVGTLLDSRALPFALRCGVGVSGGADAGCSSSAAGGAVAFVAGPAGLLLYRSAEDEALLLECQRWWVRWAARHA